MREAPGSRRQATPGIGEDLMEIGWLEDFISLASTGNFSRSAEERNISLSAFSRRIRALEPWLGTDLIDRSRYPTTLTPAGHSFHQTAQDGVGLLYRERSIVEHVWRVVAGLPKDHANCA
jgi:DNA-binding transcriptional LysR family regulator